jgi:hypothetical protein
MMLAENGLRLSKAELNALLAFAAADSSSSYFGVHFKATVPSDSPDPLVKARASDGRVAVDAFGHSSLGKDQEWFVSRAFLAGVSKLADATHNVLLKFSGASLHDATVEDSAGKEVATFSWPGVGAANGQVTFADSVEWDSRLKLPTRSRGVKSLEMKTGSLRLLARLGAAAGVDAVECYPPAQEDERLIVRAEGNDTTWVAVIDPVAVVDDVAATPPGE